MIYRQNKPGKHIPGDSFKSLFRRRIKSPPIKGYQCKNYLSSRHHIINRWFYCQKSATIYMPLWKYRPAYDNQPVLVPRLEYSRGTMTIPLLLMFWLIGQAADGDQQSLYGLDTKYWNLCLWLRISMCCDRDIVKLGIYITTYILYFSLMDTSVGMFEWWNMLHFHRHT